MSKLSMRPILLHTWLLAAAVLQAAPQANPSLPNSVKLSEVEIRLARTTTGGCSGRCEYTVWVKGDGVVEYEAAGDGPHQRLQRRVPVEEVVSLVDAFVRARFFEAAPSYTGIRTARRDGDVIHFDAGAMTDGANWDLTLRLGTQTKTVRLYYGFPEELARLRDRVDKMGGPDAWPQK